VITPASTSTTSKPNFKACGATITVSNFGRAWLANFGLMGPGQGLGALGEWLDGTEQGATAKSTGTALSTIRYTHDGETFLRYESGNPAFSRVTGSGGLQPGTFAAPASEGIQPIGSLNDL
jgi:hypothetical protein